MKKFSVCLVLLLAIPLCSCTGNSEPEPENPQPVPDIESIVEPVADAEPSSVSGFEPEPEAARSDSPEHPKNDSAVPSGAVINEYKPVTIANPETSAAPISESSYPERLEALASDILPDSGLIENELFRLINDLRDKDGVSALGIEDKMRLAARVRAAEAFESFTHTRPDNTPYNTAFNEAGFSYTGKWHGENLSSLSFSAGSLTEAEIALRMFNSLRSSPGHYRNMTENNFVQIGIGVAVTYTDGNIDITSAQMFSSL